MRRIIKFSVLTIAAAAVSACGSSSPCTSDGLCDVPADWSCTKNDAGMYVCGPGGDASVVDSSAGTDGAGPDATTKNDAGDASARDAHTDVGAGDATGDTTAGDGGDAGSTCDAGLTECQGACVPLNTLEHCGGCGTSCTQAPSGGQPACVADDAGAYGCAFTCNSPAQACNNACVSYTTVQNCGACGTACTSAPDGGAPACLESDAGVYACGFACNPGEHACHDACFPDNDPPSVTGDTCIVSPTYGVFVSPGGTDSPGGGTMTAPFQTITYALAHLGTHTRVYACGSTVAKFSENVSVTSNVSLFGGFDCTTTPLQWVYNPSDLATVSVDPATGFPLRVSGATADIEDFAFTSTSALTPGASSVAAFVTNAANVTLKRCVLTAGAGAGAAPVTTVLNYTTPPTAGSPPDGGAGGAGGTATCGFGTSTGGGGGDGPSSADGGAGMASGPTTGEDAGNDGLGGAGGKNHCGVGADNGANGMPGTAANGAQRAGALTSSGWLPQGGQNGSPGNPGQGGGGGGGLDSLTPVGGGGGGAGGCGGGGGAGGGGGGSSFALLTYQSTVQLLACTLVAGSGGNGAAGSIGQLGQGGAGYGSASCNGGYGGNGAGGGGGGGGAGGLSATIGYVGSVPTYDSSTASHLSAGTPGTGGSAAAGGDGGGNGTVPQAPGGPASTKGIDGDASVTPLILP